MKEIQVLEHVKSLIIRYGWRTVGKSAPPGISCLTMCVFGAPFAWPEKRRAMRSLELAAGTQFLTTWCDVPGRTEVEVLGVVGKAIASLVGKERPEAVVQRA